MCFSFSSSAETRCPDEARPSGNQPFLHLPLKLLSSVWPAPLYVKLLCCVAPAVSFSFFFIFLQNADLKKQLHELQAKITALSEKQVRDTSAVEALTRYLPCESHVSLGF